MNISKKLLLGTVLFLLIFLVFTAVVKSDILTRFDFDTTEKIQNHVPKSADTIFSLLSLLGSVEVTTVILLGLLLISRMFVPGFFVFAMYAAGHVVEVIGKTFLQHPGPPHLFLRYDLGFSFPSSYIQPGSSYPSGHSLRIVFLAVVVLAVLVHSHKKFGYRETVFFLFLSLLVLSMLISRVSLGEHWPSDVIGGALLGLVGGLVSSVFIVSAPKLHVRNGARHTHPKQKQE